MRYGNSAETAMNDLRDDFKAMMHDTEALLKATADVGGERMQGLRTRMNATMQKTRDALGEDGLTGYARTAARTSDQYVHEHPWTIIGAAAGTALLLGLLAGRR